MYYEINVTKDGKHFFATAPRSITTKEELKRVWKTLIAVYKQIDGYELSITKYETIGTPVEPKELIGE